MFFWIILFANAFVTLSSTPKFCAWVSEDLSTEDAANECFLKSNNYSRAVSTDGVPTWPLEWSDQARIIDIWENKYVMPLDRGWYWQTSPALPPGAACRERPDAVEIMWVQDKSSSYEAFRDDKFWNYRNFAKDFPVVLNRLKHILTKHVSSYRIGLGAFADKPTNRIKMLSSSRTLRRMCYERKMALTDNISAFAGAFKDLKFIMPSPHDDEPDDSVSAMYYASAADSGWTTEPNTLRLMILVTNRIGKLRGVEERDTTLTAEFQGSDPFESCLTEKFPTIAQVRSGLSRRKIIPLVLLGTKHRGTVDYWRRLVAKINLGGSVSAMKQIDLSSTVSALDEALGTAICYGQPGTPVGIEEVLGSKDLGIADDRRTPERSNGAGTRQPVTPLPTKIPREVVHTNGGTTALLEKVYTTTAAAAIDTTTAAMVPEKTSDALLPFHGNQEQSDRGAEDFSFPTRKKRREDDIRMVPHVVAAPTGKSAEAPRDASAYATAGRGVEPAPSQSLVSVIVSSSEVTTDSRQYINTDAETGTPLPSFDPRRRLKYLLEDSTASPSPMTITEPNGSRLSYGTRDGKKKNRGSSRARRRLSGRSDIPPSSDDFGAMDPDELDFGDILEPVPPDYDDTYVGFGAEDEHTTAPPTTSTPLPTTTTPLLTTTTALPTITTALPTIMTALPTAATALPTTTIPLPTTEIPVTTPTAEHQTETTTFVAVPAGEVLGSPPPSTSQPNATGKAILVTPKGTGESFSSANNHGSTSTTTPPGPTTQGQTTTTTQAASGPSVAAIAGISTAGAVGVGGMVAGALHYFGTGASAASAALPDVGEFQSAETPGEEVRDQVARTNSDIFI